MCRPSGTRSFLLIHRGLQSPLQILSWLRDCLRCENLLVPSRPLAGDSGFESFSLFQKTSSGAPLFPGLQACAGVAHAWVGNWLFSASEEEWDSYAVSRMP